MQPLYPISHRQPLTKVALAYVLHSCLKRRQTVTQVILCRIAEMKVFNVTEIRHPEKRSEQICVSETKKQTKSDATPISHNILSTDRK